MHTKLILIGLFFGLLGMVFNGVYQDNTYDREAYKKKMEKVDAEQSPARTTFSVKLGNKEFSYGKSSKSVDEGHSSPPVEDDSPRNLKAYRLLGLICGVLAIGCGVFYFSVKGNPRMSAAMVGVGLICVAWEYALYAVGVAVIIIFLSTFG